VTEQYIGFVSICVE